MNLDLRELLERVRPYIRPTHAADIQADADLRAVDAALATLKPAGERREAIARHNRELALGFCKASFQKRFNLRTEEYAACIVDLLNMATDFASGLMQDENSIRADCVSVPRDVLLALISALDCALGDTDPSIDPDYTDEEVKRDYPVFWVCRQLVAIRSARNGGGS